MLEPINVTFNTKDLTMQTIVPKTTRSRFLEILLNNPNINSLADDKMRSMMARIMEDLDKDGILDPISYNDDDDGFWGDDLESASEIKFDESRTEEEKDIALEFLHKPKEKTKQETQQEENEEIITLESLKRVREKRRALAKDPESTIILDEDDFEPDDEEQIMPNSYGRTPLHEAVGMRNLDAVKKFVDEKKYIEDTDNNGNTPYMMALQEGYEEAVEVFETAGVAV